MAKILHVCLSCFYIDDYNYQENVLPRIHYEKGNDVRILASTETFLSSKRVGYVFPREYKTKEGIPIKRISYRKILPRFVMRKIRMYKGVKAYLNDFQPDYILFHGVPAYELLTFARYKKRNSNVKLYVDSHEDANNSANNFLSRVFLHSLFYRFVVSVSLKYIDKILYISEETKDFLVSYYKVPKSITEFFPLGGNIYGNEKKTIIRNNIRNKLGLSNETIVFIHTGKFDENKKTLELVSAFKSVRDKRFRLIIIGQPIENPKFYKSFFDSLANDERIVYLGWKSADELLSYIAASDLYCQPGSQSATMQNSLCAGTPVMFSNAKSHYFYMGSSSLMLDGDEDIKIFFEMISKDKIDLKEMSEKSLIFAKKYLDYNKLALRILK